MLDKQVTDVKGRPAYIYESYAPYASNGTHQLAKVVTKVRECRV